MQKVDAEEAAPIALLTLEAIMAVSPLKGRPGADLRTAIGDFNADALPLIQADSSGARLAAIFDLARKTGLTLPQVTLVRAVAVAQTPISLGAILMKNSLINLSLATECRIIANTTFNSREAVEEMKDEIGETFDAMQEIAADDMDNATYAALVTLNAAAVEYLLNAQRPLPRMLNFQFAGPGPTLVFAYRLYQDAGRADEVREENAVIHPLFAQPFGRALSA